LKHYSSPFKWSYKARKLEPLLGIRERAFPRCVSDTVNGRFWAVSRVNPGGRHP
jgi:hypothetical protein